MEKKTEVVYNSKLQKSSSVLLTPDKSLKKICGYPSLSPNQFVGSSSKSYFKVSDSSTGGKLPIHGPRRNVKPSHFYSYEFEIKRVIFKVDKSQIKNCKSICNLAMSPNSGYVLIIFLSYVYFSLFSIYFSSFFLLLILFLSYCSDDAIFFGGVRCTFWSLGESLKPGGTVNNFVIATFCYHLYSLAFGHPNVSKALYFFSNISVSVLIFIFCFLPLFSLSLIVYFL
jgi:hypothetical protein